MNRRRFSVTLASAFGAATHGVGAQANAPYKIGATWPLTGPLATFTAEVLTGGQVAIDDVNRRGGVNGHQLQLVVEDSAGTPQGGITAMRKLAQVDGVQALISILTNVVTAQIPLADQFKVPTLSIIETPGLLDKSLYSFAHAPTWGIIVPLVAKDWKAKGIKKVYGLMLNNALGLLEGPACRAAAQSAGAEYGEALLDPDVTDFRGIVERVRDFGAQAVVVPGQGGTVEINATRQLLELGTKAQIYSLGQDFTMQAFRNGIGPYTEGMIFGGLYLDPNAARTFVTQYRAKMGYVPGTQTGELYDVARMIAFTIGKAGYNGPAIQHALATLTDFPSVFGGTVSMAPDHRTVIKAIGLFQVRAGKLVRLSTTT